MNAQLLSQIALPVSLAIMMFSMGLALRVDDFSRVFRKPEAAILGIALQLLMLPVLAWLVIELWQLSTLAAAGLLLLAVAKLPKRRPSSTS